MDIQQHEHDTVDQLYDENAPLRERLRRAEDQLTAIREIVEADR